MSQYLLETRGICKTYGDVRANDNIHFAVEAGTKHALIGENGAGKSTLVNILYGAVTADQGDIIWQGQAVRINSPQAARQLGIGIIFQHFALFDSLTVADNIRLGMDSKTARQMVNNKQIKQISEKYELQINPDQLVGRLSVGEKQRVEILRSLLRSPQLLILDEPTSVLTPVETRTLFRLLNQLTDEGRSIIFISHKLHEVEDLCTTATILRKGKTVFECHLAETERKTLISKMVGDVDVAQKTPQSNATAKNLLTASDIDYPISDTMSLQVKNLSLQQGTITGVAGISGNGQNGLLDILSGEKTITAKHIRYADENIGRWSVSQRMAAGILSVPTERQNRASVNDLSLLLNTLIGDGTVRKLYQLLDFPTLSQKAAHIIQHFDVATPGPGATAASLSGGNLQKFIIGRTLHQQPTVLVVANPTWGVDVRAAAFIHEQIIRLAESGSAVLIISEDLDELFYLCDNIAVINNGQLSAADATSTISKDDIGQQMSAAVS